VKKLCVIFGGMSTENEVSCISGASVIKNLNIEKYDIFPIFIDENGTWFKVEITEENKLKMENKKQIENVFKYLKQMDVIFPVLHGLYGEDGTIQGLLELLKIPYVGCGVLASSVGMDKVYTKIIFNKAGINQTKYIYLRSYNDKYIYVDDNFNEKILDLKEILEVITEKIKFPMFVKPSNSGSSVGISKVNNEKELQKAIMEALKFDRKILVEEAINGIEVECAVLGNENVISSCVGEIKPADEFYSYDAKYKNQESKTLIPAKISVEKSEEIRKLAVKAFKAIDGKGLSRVDFFIENKSEKLYINEINTLPGFTNISMYPKLFEQSGINYSDLLDKLVSLAM
jgi:D-alanine-D-alanine ligase